MSSSSADRSRGDAPWRRENADGSITVVVHVQPGAKRSEIAGVHGDALKIRIASPPVEGRANAALIAYLAEAFGVPKRNVTIMRGETGRQKTVRIAAPTARPDRAWGRT